MAIISYKFIEQPIRNIPKKIKNWQIILVGISLSIFQVLGISSLFNPIRSQNLLVTNQMRNSLIKGEKVLNLIIMTLYKETQKKL